MQASLKSLWEGIHVRAMLHSSWSPRFLELHGSSEGQQLLHTISQERVTLKGQGWQLAYTSDGLGYIFKATESCYVAQLLKRSIYVEDDHAYMQGEQGKTYFDNCDVQVVPRYLKLQSPSGEAHVKMYEVSHFAHGCKVRGQVDIRKFCFDFDLMLMVLFFIAFFDVSISQIF